LTDGEHKQFDWSERETPRLACPYCGPNFKILNDELDLQNRGFVKKQTSNPDEIYLLAEYGLCGNSHAWSDEVPSDSYGIPLILESQYDPSPKVEQLTDDEEIAVGGEPMLILQPNLVKKNLFKTSVGKALGDYLLDLDPPYLVEPFISASQKDRSESESVGRVNRANEWFTCLWPFIKDSLDFKNDKNSTNKENVLLTIYLHKAAEMQHVEPLWLFCKRFGLNKRALMRALASFPAELPKHLQNLFKKIERDYEPESSTIESLVNNLALYKICPQMNGDEMQNFIQNSSDFLQRMKSASYDGEKSCYEFLISNPLISDAISVGGFVLPSAGIIEMICIYAILRQKNEGADDFLRTVFPSEADPLWKTVLSSHGAKIGMPRSINSLINLIEKNSQ